MRAALKADRMLGYSKAIDESADENGEVQNLWPIDAGGYLLENDDIYQQRVFKKVEGVYKLQRIPFYS
ncbi:hypothetical protein [Lysobacter sp. CA199]|uniref:hypothetical protein n=1 Tax=Lysobacter sp. CA199 TaxID=3455608 RepID=UPI003F8CFA40